MPIDQRYRRDERLLIRLAIVLGLAAGLLALILTKTLGSDSEQVSPVKVWNYINEVAPEQGIDPEFVYALAWAESSLDAKARSSVARGMMQLTKSAWREVSDESYRHAWNWKTNIRVGVDYLAFCRDFLESHDSFSYPLLAASYRYGPYYVKGKGFTIAELRQPENEIYKRIFGGNIRPVAPPQ
ncbi:MAG: transglycosylase SLT domain-containing protein [Verrucomicrobiota bacterium]